MLEPADRVDGPAGIRAPMPGIPSHASIDSFEDHDHANKPSVSGFPQDPRNIYFLLALNRLAYLNSGCSRFS